MGGLVGNQQSSPAAGAKASPDPNEAAIWAALSSSTLITDPFPAYALLRENAPAWRSPTGYVVARRPPMSSCCASTT